MPAPLLIALPLALLAQDRVVTAQGTVYDSLAKGPLAGAVVRMTPAGDSAVGEAFTTTSDSAGRFRFEALPSGRFLATFSHPAIDTMGFEPTAVEVTVRGATQFRLGTPSAATIFRTLCPGARRDGPMTVVFGSVVRASTGEPLPEAHVIISWMGTAIVDAAAVRKAVADTAAVGDGGAFAMCQVPDAVSLQLRAAEGADTSGAVPMRLSSGSVRHVAFAVGRAWRADVQRPDGSVGLAWRGPTRLRGIVTNPSGEPMPGVRVEVLGTERPALTNAQGSYVLDSLPEGTQVLEVRAIGYEPLRPVVHLAGGGPLTADVQMLYRAVTLGEVKVFGSYERNLELFDQRRRTSASGYYLRPEEVARRPPGAVMAQLLQEMPRTLVNCRTPAQCFVTMYNGRAGEGSASVPGSSREQCVPSLYVDGILQLAPDYNFLTVSQIAAVEVYPGANFRPIEFMDPRNNCGSVVFWTNLRGPRR